MLCFGLMWPAVALAQDDSDGDGIADVDDVCPTVPDPAQADEDMDKVGDACDNCPQEPNPLDPDTGTQPACKRVSPKKPVKKPTSKVGATCVDGKLQGVDTEITRGFIRPQLIVYDSIDKTVDARVTTGFHFFALKALDGYRCIVETGPNDGGKKPIGLTKEPAWYGKAGFYLDPGWRERTTLGLELGVDYAPLEGSVLPFFTFGAQLHAFTSFAEEESTTLQIGPGFTVTILDVFVLTPFVNVDVYGNFGLTYGTLVSFDLGILEDLGVSKDKIRALVLDKN